MKRRGDVRESADIASENDTYARVISGIDKIGETECIPASAWPLWNHPVYLDVDLAPSSSESVEIELYDKDTIGSDDFLGKAVVAATTAASICWTIPCS